MTTTDLPQKTHTLTTTSTIVNRWAQQQKIAKDWTKALQSGVVDLQPDKKGSHSMRRKSALLTDRGLKLQQSRVQHRLKILMEPVISKNRTLTEWMLFHLWERELVKTQSQALIRVKLPRNSIFMDLTDKLIKKIVLRTMSTKESWPQIREGMALQELTMSPKLAKEAGQTAKTPHSQI